MRFPRQPGCTGIQGLGRWRQGDCWIFWPGGLLSERQLLLNSWEPYELAVDTSFKSSTIIGVIRFHCSLHMGLEGFVASGAFAVVVVAFALVVLGVSIVRTFGPFMVMSRNPTRVGFLFTFQFGEMCVVYLLVRDC